MPIIRSDENDGILALYNCWYDDTENFEVEIRKENIDSVFHCATRLRFKIKDMNKIDESGLQKIDGVLGIKKVAASFQIIIGPNVAMVYDHLCEITGLDKNTAIDENLDADEEKGKLTPKKCLNNVISYIMNSMAPIIPVLI